MLRRLRQYGPRFLSPGPRVLAVAAVVLAGCGASAPPVPKTVQLADPAQAAVNPVTVSPFPGTVDASPATQISFLGGRGMSVSNVSVVGSRSGDHDGTLEAYSTGTGESFLPAHPFVAGEQVRVSARVAQGAGSATVRTSFVVAIQASISRQPFPRHPGLPADVQHYLSAPAITPSTVRVLTSAQSGATPGDFFLAPYQGAGSPGPMIVDQAGGLIWFDPLPRGDSATNFRVQRYEGQDVLTWWQGRILQLGFGQGTDEIYDSSYRPIAHVDAGNGYGADLHEFVLDTDGTAWIDAFDPVEVNLASMGGSAHGVVSDSVVQEIDVKTGLVMWEWHALGHIPLRDSYAPMAHTSHPWDYVHINSIDAGSSGQLLLSSRNTRAVFDVSEHTGALIWRIGGRFSSFKHGAGTFFYWQHDAAWQPGGLVSVFDNGSEPPEEAQTRGLLLKPSTATRTVTLVKQFTNPNATLLAASQGDLLSLPGGNWLMGYGGLPNFTEYDGSGRVLFDATLGPQVQSYRTYLARWSARPHTLPSVAAQVSQSGQVTVEASWNGATAVTAWRILAGTATGSLAGIATVPKQGFETKVTVHTTAPEIAVAALDASGKALATSATIPPSG
jgi:hypothetical protein